MKKYFLTGFYLLVLLAIFHHPVTLPSEGKSIPTWEDQVPEPTTSDTYAFRELTHKTTFSQKKEAITGQLSNP